MAPATLAELRALKRNELQALCKENDIKANGKTDVLIASLSDKLGLADGAPSATTPASTAALKKTPTTASAKGKKATKATPVQVSEPQPSTSTAAVPSTHSSLAPYIASIDTIVERLEGRLTAANAVVAKLESASPPATLSLEDVDALVKKKLADLAALQDKKLADALAACNGRVAELEARLDEQDELFSAVSADLDALSSEVPTSCKACEALEASVDTLRRNLLSRLDILEARPAVAPIALAAAKAQPMIAPAEQQRSRAVSFASPALSDAPPTQSLLSFDSPSGSPATPAQDSPFGRRQSVGLRKATPFKLGAPAAIEAEGTPVTAVPSHMLAAAASAARRTQRTSLLATPTAGEPESPAPPTPNAALGKHARYSDASDQSVVLAASASPEQARATTPFEGEGFFTAPNSVKKLVLGEQSARKDAHARKKVRVSSGTMSTGTVIDHGEESEEFFDDEGGDDKDEPVDSFARDEPQGSEATEQAHDDVEEDVDELDEHEQVRDYLVATKTGDSPAPAPKPASTAQLSVHDPGFFAAAAGVISPARSTPGRRAFSFANENAPASPAPAAAGGRKSLPLAALPFPLVSPFRAAPSPAAATASARKAPGSAAAEVTMKSFFSDASNRSSASSASSGAGLFASASAKKIRSRAGTLSAGAPPTPLAPRTLFGTESDGAGRFGEGGVEAGDRASPEKGWTWERGAFAGGAF
ncbi:hypothetical protein JCM10450v2_001822 [Rhodotorula kratochvilovae]